MENEFDWDDLSDAEIEQQMDEIVEAFGTLIEENDHPVSLLNANKLAQLKFSYLAMRYLTRGMDAVVTYKLYEPYKTMGSVSVESESLEFDDPKWLSRAAEFASNVELYPLENGKVRMTFTFHGLTTPIQ